MYAMRTMRQFLTAQAIFLGLFAPAAIARQPALFAETAAGANTPDARADTASASRMEKGAAPWSPKLAAAYLDSRQKWWSTWSVARRDHETACVSCHTAVPYALSRSALRKPLMETAPSAPEATMLAGVEKRVKLWNTVDPFYTDAEMVVAAH